MWMHTLSPYRNIDDEHYVAILANFGNALTYEDLNDGNCSQCGALARECITCNKLLCRDHYKGHQHTDGGEI